ncbi:DUF362 domain-containing protein [Pseudodesulfovibrio sp. JC047]|nr:DUF362 domain-containing protein [Pseudodesulfovibrio sp. JC047]
MNFPVAMLHVPEYAHATLETAVDHVFAASALHVTPGQRVLVKPNLVNGRNARHSTSNPAVVKTVCGWLLDHGAHITVADSPAIGPASYVARNSGLAQALAPLGLSVVGLKKAVPLPLTQGGHIGISQNALEADRILNIPKLKVHGQMVMSCAVKNLFGCVVGFRKALAHNRLGHDRALFQAMLMDVSTALPQCHHLVDGIHAMHKNGPIDGELFPLNLLAACPDDIAVDTAIYSLLGLTPDQVPLWTEAISRNKPGAHLEALHFPLAHPSDFDPTGFTMAPDRELSFAPSRIISGRIRSLLKYLKKQ